MADLAEADAKAETSLVVAARGGDRAAFEELVRRTAQARVRPRVPGDRRPAPHRRPRAGNLPARVAEAPRAGRPHEVSRVAGSRRETRRDRSRAARIPTEARFQERTCAARSVGTRRRRSSQRATGGAATERGAAARAVGAPLDARGVSVAAHAALPLGADYDTIAKQLALTNGSLRGLLWRGMKMLRRQMTNDQTGNPNE